MTRSARLLIALLSVLAMLGACVVASPPAAMAATTCTPQVPAPSVHAPNSLSPSGLTTSVSTVVGEIGKLPPVTPQAWDGADRIFSIAQVGDTVYAAGILKTYVKGGVSYPRNNIVAYSATTGAVLASFAPNVNGAINAITPACNGKSIYMVGDFTSVDGVTRNHAAKVDRITGALSPWNANLNKPGTGVRYLGGHLVVSGSFTTVGGVPRTQMASVSDGNTGGVDNWLNMTVAGYDTAGSQNIRSIIPNPAGTYAVGIGNMMTINGASHRRIFILNTSGTTAALMPWSSPWVASNNNSNNASDCSSGIGAPERGIAWLPDGSKFVTVSTGGAHSSSVCDAAALWSGNPATFVSTTVAPLKINYTGGDSLSGVACTNKSCVVTGHHKWANNPPLFPFVKIQPCIDSYFPQNLNEGNSGYGCRGKTGVDRAGITELDTTNWLATAWNPGRSRQRAMDNVAEFTPQGLLSGSDGDLPRNDLALWTW